MKLNAYGEEIITEAKKLFDVAGVVPHQADSILALGLVQNEEKDMDDFLKAGEAWTLRGFQIYAQPGIERLVQFIIKKGLSAEAIGLYGYPRGSVLNLKRLAVMAGLARWGKNAMVLHPEYGPRIRLSAVKVHDVHLAPPSHEANIREIDPRCQGCNACIDICPPGILEPYYMRDPQSCPSNGIGQTGKVILCDKCWKVCPAARVKNLSSPA